MIKLALTDLDNTLIPMGAPHASMRAISAIHAMLDAGLRFGPVSGRVPAAMRWMFGGDAACGRTGAYVNGQLVYADGKLIHAELLSGKMLSEIGAWIAPHEGCALVVYDLDDISETTDGAAYLMGIDEEELARHEGFFGRHPKTIKHLKAPTYIKANLRCDAPENEKVALRNALRAAFPDFDFVFPAKNGPFIDILPAGWSKGHAVKVLAEYLGLSLDEVVVFGDSENDVSMFQAVEYSVAMRNSSAEALAAATYRIGLSADDAVADALFALVEAAGHDELPAFLQPIEVGNSL